MIPEFSTKKELFKWLSENNRLVINTKKSTMKKADGFSYSLMLVDDKGLLIDKSEKAIKEDTERIKVRSIINTTRLLDSHGDVHIDQLWNKSLKENTDNYLCNQHDFSFEGVISDKVHAFAKQMSWSELGYSGYSGNTQALVFDSIIDKNESPFMFDKYVQGKVKQHSVGMMYKQLFLCINDPSYKEYFANWEKYFPDVANKDDAEEQGYFYAVTQAKVIEGSAVLKGSNFVTPTQSVEAAKDTSIEIEQSPDIQTKQYLFNANMI